MYRLRLSSARRDRLEEGFRNCVAYRSEDDDSPILYAAIQRYLQRRGGGRIESDLIDIEFFSLEDALVRVLNLVLDHSVEARCWAFSRLSANARKILIATNSYSKSKGAKTKTDPLISTLSTSSGSISYDHQAVGRDIQSRLDNLEVECKMYIKSSDSSSGVTLGSYNPANNTISLATLPAPFSLSGKSSSEIMAITREAFASLVAQTFLHELTHLCERCAVEKGPIADSILEQVTDPKVLAFMQELAGKFGYSQRQINEVIMGARADPTKMLAQIRKESKTERDSLNLAFAHCSRFKLTLLKLTSNPEFQLIRPSFSAAIEATILADDPLQLAQTKPMGSLAKAGRFAYQWEEDLLDDIEYPVAFVPRSYVASTDTLSDKIFERIAPKLRRNALEALPPENLPGSDLLFLYNGEANLMKADFPEGEDAFGSIARVLGGGL